MSKISLVIAREYNQRVRKKSFIITTLLMPILMVALTVVPVIIAQSSQGDTRQIVVVDPSGIIAPNLTNSAVAHFTPTSTTYPQVAQENPNADGYLVINEDVVDDPSKLKLYSKGTTTLEIENDIRRQVSSLVQAQRIAQSNVEGLDSLIQSVKANATLQTFQIDEKASTQEGGEKESSSAASMGVAYVSGFIIYMFIFIYGAMVMQGVIEEKSSRIIEVVVSSIKPFQLMMGKIVGIAMVALTQVVIWIIVGSIGMAVLTSMLGADATAAAATGSMAAGGAASGLPSELSGVMGALMDPWYIISVVGCFILFFVGGYLLYAAMFAAIGSGVDNVADTQQLQLPVTIPLILALIVMMSVMRDPTGSLAFWFSIIPFTSPIIMMARVAYGVPMWEVLLSLVLLYGTFVAMVWFAAKIYRVGIFMYGKKPSLMEIIRWSKYKS